MHPHYLYLLHKRKSLSRIFTFFYFHPLSPLPFFLLLFFSLSFLVSGGRDTTFTVAFTSTTYRYSFFPFYIVACLIVQHKVPFPSLDDDDSLPNIDFFSLHRWPFTHYCYDTICNFLFAPTTTTLETLDVVTSYILGFENL